MPLGHGEEHSGVHRIPWDSPGAEQTYIEKVLATASDNLVAFWPLNETSGTIADDVNSATTDYDALYSGVTLGQEGIGDGEKCPLFDGINDFVGLCTSNGGTTDFVDTFNPNEFTILLWAKHDTWTDSDAARLFTARSGSQNQMKIEIAADTANRIIFQRTGGNVSDQVNLDGVTTTDWVCLGMTVSDTNDQLIAYYNGSQTGLTQTGIGTFTGTFGVAGINLGTYLQASLFFGGWLYGFSVWNIPLSDAQMLDLATV